MVEGGFITLLCIFRENPNFSKKFKKLRKKEKTMTDSTQPTNDDNKNDDENNDVGMNVVYKNLTVTKQ